MAISTPTVSHAVKGLRVDPLAVQNDCGKAGQTTRKAQGAREILTKTADPTLRQRHRDIAQKRAKDSVLAKADRNAGSPNLRAKMIAEAGEELERLAALELDSIEGMNWRS